MGKTRDLFKKIRDIKGTFHEKTGTIKDTNGMDLTEADDIKKRWQQYTEELYKKLNWNNKLWKFWKRWEYQTTLPASWETCMQVKKQQLELDMEQQTDAVCCHPAYLTYM